MMNRFMPLNTLKKIIEAVKENASRYGFDIPEIWIEPGRSLVGDAGTTLYTVGSQKKCRVSANMWL